jgi:hypothetical protein
MFVHIPSIFVILVLTVRFKSALSARRKAVNDARTKHRSLQIKIGMLRFSNLMYTLTYVMLLESEQRKLRDAQNEPSTKKKSAKLREEILRLTMERLKVAKQYTVSLFSNQVPRLLTCPRNSCAVLFETKRPIPE